jgi:hypothetical protein
MVICPVYTWRSVAIILWLHPAAIYQNSFNQLAIQIASISSFDLN